MRISFQLSTCRSKDQSTRVFFEKPSTIRKLPQPFLNQLNCTSQKSITNIVIAPRGTGCQELAREWM